MSPPDLITGAIPMQDLILVKRPPCQSQRIVGSLKDYVGNYSKGKVMWIYQIWCQEERWGGRISIHPSSSVVVSLPQLCDTRIEAKLQSWQAENQKCFLSVAEQLLDPITLKHGDAGQVSDQCIHFANFSVKNKQTNKTPSPQNPNY